MTQRDDTIEHIRALGAIQSWLLGARLQAARFRHFEKIVDAVAALDERWGIKRRTYYSHESGDRKPKMHDLRRYAEMFDVPVEFFLYGDDSIIPDTQVSVYASEKRRKLDVVEPADEVDSKGKINHAARSFDSNSSHNSSVRSTVVLSADEIKTLSTDRGALARMSGERLPLPPFIEAGQNTFWYVIPKHDLSMVAEGQPFSLSPGAMVLVDLDRPIAPGHFVLADLEGRDQPVVREYQLVTDPKTPALFALKALNPAMETIRITRSEDYRTIGRIIFYGNRL